MKRFLSLCLTTLLVSATWAQTVAGIVNDDGVTIYYELTSLSGGLVTSAAVTYNRDDANYNSYSGNVVVPSVVANGSKKVTYYDVLSVGEKAFYLSTGLTSVTLPESLTSVGSEAFGGCTGLKSLTVNATSAPSCKDDSFDEVDTETCVLYVPEGCVDIYSEADGWKEFTTIKVIGDNDDDGDGDGDGDGDEGTPLKDGAQFLYDGLYYNVVSSDERTIEVTYAGDYNVAGPEKYSGSVNIPETVTYENVTYTVVGIGHHAFFDCFFMTDVTIPSSVTYIDRYGFSSCGISKIELPESITSIGDYVLCFNGANLEEVVIRANITELPGMAFYECTSLKSVSFPEGLEKIYSNAFYNCKSLTDITLPESVSSIDANAFYNCTSLSSITSLNTTPPSVTNTNVFTNVPTSVCVLYVPEESIESYQADDIWKVFTKVEAEGKVYTGYDVQTLAATNVTSTSATLNATVTYVALAGSATYSVYFDYWTNDDNVVTLSDVNTKLTKSVTTVTADISGLSKETTYGYRVRVVTPDGDTIYGNGESFTTYVYDFEAEDGLCYNITSDSTVELTYQRYGQPVTYAGNIEVPETVEYEGTTYTVTGIGDYAFFMSGITSVQLPETITYLGEGAVYMCEDLTEIVLPESITHIGMGAFLTSYYLKSITLGNSVETIEDMAFGYCTSLEEIVIPNSVTSLGWFQFTEDYSLRKATLGAGLTEVPRDAFFNNSSLEEVIFMGDNITSIGEYAFWSCSSLQSIDLPNSVKTIGEMAFAACTSLESIVIPNNVTTMGYSVFYNCTSLESVTLGSSVTTVGTYAFRNCPALAEVTSLNPTPPTCGTLTFQGVDTSTCLLYVPDGAYEAYSTADTWQDFYNTIEMIKFEVLTYEATNVTETSATLNGFVKEGYDTTVFRKGFMYWIDDPNVVTTITIDDDSNEISYTINGLTPQTNYSYHTFAITGTGIEYGEDVTFYTEDTTGINGIHISFDGENVEGIYSTSGQKLNTTVKGVNIIRYADGTVKKLYVK